MIASACIRGETADLQNPRSPSLLGSLAAPARCPASIQENRTVIHRIAIACNAVIEFAMMIGHADITIPYAIHSTTPNTKTAYIDTEIESAERDLQICSN
jgi:hypothetical protein